MNYLAIEHNSAIIYSQFNKLVLKEINLESKGSIYKELTNMLFNQEVKDHGIT